MCRAIGFQAHSKMLGGRKYAAETSGNLHSLLTLIVPTFNRPVQLAKLLRLLESQCLKSRILVLDSSSADRHAANQQVINASKMRICLLRLPETTAPWQKFLSGAQNVETPYCSLCADDDLILVDSLSSIVRFLEENDDYSVAHGWYFTFYDSSHFGVTSIAYRGESIANDDPVRRLYSLFRKYEALTYGVHRTDVFRDSLQRVQPLDSMLAKELMEGALSLVKGKAARLPVLYYGRSLAPSEAYRGWHPFEFIYTDPQALFASAKEWRRTLLTAIAAHSGVELSEEQGILIDLVLLRYIGEHTKPEFVEFFIDSHLKRHDVRAALQNLWSTIPSSESHSKSITERLATVKWIRRIGKALLPKASSRDLARLGTGGGNVSFVSNLRGERREYLFYANFLRDAEVILPRESIAKNLVSVLNGYS
jgi:glycosyltransferase domain-containing protein